MRKKLVALFLVATMALSMTACGSTTKSKTVDDAVNQLSSFEVNQADSEMVFAVKQSTGDTNFSVKMVAVNMGDNTSALEIQYKMDGGTYAPVTTLFLTDDAVYINATQAMDFITTLEPTYSMLKAYVTLSSDYVMITKTELMQYISALGVDTSELDLSTAKTASIDSKKVTEIIFGIIKETSEKSGTSFFTLKDDVLNMVITPENSDKILTALANIDITTYIDKLGDTSIASKKTEYAQVFKESIEEFQSTIKSEEIKPDITATAKTEGESGNKKDIIVLNAKLTNSDESINGVMNITFSEKATASYTLPTKPATMTEVMSILSKLGIY